MLVVSWGGIECRCCAEVQTECAAVIAQVHLIIMSMQYARIVIVGQIDTYLRAVFQCFEGSNAVDGVALRIGLADHFALQVTHVGYGFDSGCAVNGYSRCLQHLSTVCLRRCCTVCRVVSHGVVYRCQRDVFAGFLFSRIGEEREFVRQRWVRDSCDGAHHDVV